jgi:hypothetical protein
LLSLSRKIALWRATVDEGGHYSLAVAYDAAAHYAFRIGNAPSTSNFVRRLCAVPSWASKSFTSGFLDDAELHAKRMRSAAFRRKRKA